MKLTVTTWFPHDDENCDGDYYAVTIHNGDDLIAQWTDYYHDKGSEKAEGFIQGASYVQQQHGHVLTWAGIDDNLIGPMEEFPWDVDK